MNIQALLEVDCPRQMSNSGIAYHVSGTTESEEGTPIVCIHGVGLALESWQYQIDHLTHCQHPCRVYAIDLPGHAHSTVEADSLAEFVEGVKSFVDEVVGQPAVIMGHSLGAMIALHYATKEAQAAANNCLGVIALNAIQQRNTDAQQHINSRVQQLEQGDIDINAPLNRWFSDNDAAERSRTAQWLSYAIQHRLAGYTAAYRVFASNAAPNPQQLSTLPFPALFLTGTLDLNSTPAMSQSMAQQTPQGRAHIIENAGHVMQLTHPSEVNSALSDFLADFLDDFLAEL